MRTYDWRRLPLIALLGITLPRHALVRSLFTAKTLGKPLWVRVAHAFYPIGVSVGTMHAVSGASGAQAVTIEPVAPSQNPAKVQLGDDFIWVFRGSGGNQPKSYSVEGLPEGGTFSEKITAGVGSLSGRPTIAGEYHIRIRGWEHSGQRGPTTPLYIMRLTVQQKNGLGSYQHWAQLMELSGEDAYPSRDLDRDGLNNLLEYAFRFNPKLPEAHSGGQEGFAPVSTPQIVRRTPASLQIAYLRRRSASGADIVYQLQSSPDLENWNAVEGREQLAIVDSTWEVVVVSISIPRGDRNWHFRMRTELQSRE